MAERDQLVLDGDLDLNDLVDYFIGEEGPQFTPARKRLNWVENPQSDGAAQAGSEDHFTNAELVVRVTVVEQTSDDAARAKVDTLTDKLQSARKIDGGLPLVWWPRNAAEPRTWYVLNAEYDEMPVDDISGYSTAGPTVVIHFYLAPFGYGPEAQMPLGYTESFAWDGLSGGRWRFDTGSGTLAVSAGSLVPSSAVFKVLYLPFTTTDSTVTMRVKVGADTGGEVGGVIKRISSGEYLYARYGVGSVQIRKVSGGATDTLLATTAFAATASTFYWLQAEIVDDDIGVYVYADAQNPLVTVNPTVLASTSYTLTGSEPGSPIGEGIYGNVGIRQDPPATYADWLITDYVVRGMPDYKMAGDPLGVFEVPDVKGKVSAEGRMIVVEGAGQSKGHFEFGVEQRSYDADDSTPLILDSTALVTSGLGGDQGIVLAWYNPTGGTNTAVISKPLSTSAAVAVCGLGQLQHVGIYKVKARVAGTAGVRARLAWRSGLTPFVRNNFTNPIAGTSAQEVDLGTVILKRTAQGEPNWTGRIEAYSPESANGVLQVDYVMLIPLERFGVAKAPLRPVVPDVFSARDEFNQGAAAMSGAALDVGGSWTTGRQVGATGALEATGTNFTINTTAHQAERVAVSDASLNAGRYALAGGATYAAVQVQASMGFSGGIVSTADDQLRWGVLMRYVDANNWLMAVRQEYLSGGVPRSRLRVFKRVAGAVTLLGSKNDTARSFESRTVALSVDVAGGWQATIWQAGTRQPATPTLLGEDSVLATGQALATGRIGLYDAYIQTPAMTRTFDNFTAFSTTQDVVMYPNSRMEIRSDSAVREGLNIWGQVPAYAGRRFYLSPGTSRMAVKARRTNVDEGQPDTSPTLDAITVSVRTRARYLIPITDE